MQKFMIIERFQPEKVKSLYQRFEKHGRLLPNGVEYIDSWIDENVSVCYQLMRSEHIDGIQQWVDQWNDLADFEIVPVISSEEAKAKVFDHD